MSDEQQQPTLDDLRLSYAISCDDRDMSLYRYNRDAGVAEWERIRDEAYERFDNLIAREILQTKEATK